MYVWIANSFSSDPQKAGTAINRLIITREPDYSEVESRISERIGAAPETIANVSFLGYIPGIASTSGGLQSSVYFVDYAYQLPEDPQLSNVRRVVTNFIKKLDTDIGKKFSPPINIGPIETGVKDPADVARLALIVSLVEPRSEEAIDIVFAEVFEGQVPRENIKVIAMRSLMSTGLS